MDTETEQRLVKKLDSIESLLKQSLEEQKKLFILMAKYDDQYLIEVEKASNGQLLQG